MRCSSMVLLYFGKDVSFLAIFLLPLFTLIDEEVNILKQSHCALPNRISVIWHKKEIRATGGQIAQKSMAKCSTKWTWISWHKYGKLLLAFYSTFLHASQWLNNFEWCCSGVGGMVTSSAFFLDSGPLIAHFFTITLLKGDKVLTITRIANWGGEANCPPPYPGRDLS